MNISYNWLKDLIDTRLSVEETACELTRVGLAVEGVHPHGDDHVFDIDLTSNRPDCLSHLGVARELAVIRNSKLKNKNSETEGKPKAENQTLVNIEDADLCHRFTARILRNVKIGQSPQWLVDRLEAIGERAINNVADITNYVMHELGQPMHSFDLDKLTENRIVVRRAKNGETITTLDEVERKLDDRMLAICDAKKPVAVAGVMGGLASGITETTTNVLLEVAYFDRANIRATSRKLNLATEASYRFERGVDIENLIRASNRATELICELAGGEAAEFIDVYPTKFTPSEVESADISAATRRLTGLDVSTEDCNRILNALGIVVSDESAIRDPQSTIYLSPSWRHDIAIEEDLVEEVARHAGYEKIADELPPAFGAGEYQPTELRERRLRYCLAALGFDEALSYSFIDLRHDGPFQLVPHLVDGTLEEKFVTLRDSVIEGAVRMRPTILPGLLEAVRLNMNHQRRDIKLFEIGKVFAAVGGDGLPKEQKLLALALTGSELQEGRSMTGRPLDLYDAKGAIEAALGSAGIASVSCRASEATHLRLGQSAEILIGDQVLGYVGRLSEDVAARYKFRQAVFVAELDIATALAGPGDLIAYKPLAKFPGVARDVSFVVPRRVELGAILSEVSEVGIDLCRKASFVDVYEGKGLAENERSVTIRLEYRSDERTLTEEEVEPLHQMIVDQVTNKLGIVVRV